MSESAKYIELMKRLEDAEKTGGDRRPSPCSRSSGAPETDAYLVRISETRATWTTCDQWAHAGQLMTHHARRMERDRDELASALRLIEKAGPLCLPDAVARQALYNCRLGLDSEND